VYLKTDVILKLQIRNFVLY